MGAWARYVISLVPVFSCVKEGLAALPRNIPRPRILQLNLNAKQSLWCWVYSASGRNGLLRLCVPWEVGMRSSRVVSPRFCSRYVSIALVAGQVATKLQQVRAQKALDGGIKAQA